MQNSLNKLISLGLVISLLGLAPKLFAQIEENPVPEKEGTQLPTKKKKKISTNVKLDFVDEMIEGNTDKPYEMMMMKKPDQNLKKILKFREHFDKEMESSFDDVR